MLELVDMLAALRPELLSGGGPVSVAKIETTRPLYLVFTDDIEYPRCVVQFGQEATIKRLDAWLTYLHPALPDMIAESLACVCWHDGDWMHVQSGLPGLPWFRLGHHARDLGAWVRLRSRALATLRRFQGVVAANTAWRTVIGPGDELRRQLEVCRKQDHALASTLIRSATRCATSLDALGARAWPWQHGDYCFNNLLVADDRIGVIDFEEFGETSVPLHDEFSLAFSSHDFMGHLSDAPSLREHVATCISESVVANPMPRDCLEGLLLHHLLWRLNQCATRPRRAAVAHALHRQLEMIAGEAESSVRTF